MKYSLSVLRRDIYKNRYIYIMAVPVLAYFFIFNYIPMYGNIIAFKDFNPVKGIFASPWVGLKHFIDFFGSYYAGRVIINTLLISFYSIIWSFPMPIILALLLNEVRNQFFKRSIQTITYLPHFISIIVICGLILDFTKPTGIVNDIVALFGGGRTDFLQKPEFFRTVYIVSGIWQEVGWESILFLASLTNIGQELYQSAMLDGAGRLSQMIHVTLPGIMPTIVIVFILRIGSFMNVSFDKIVLLYNPLTYSTADVISTFVYRKGLQEFNYSYSAAIGLFNTVINFGLLVLANHLSKRVTEESLW